MVDQRKQVCENCTWWASEEGNDHGECRRSAPQKASGEGCGCWPGTHRAAWCGEWMLKLDEPGTTCDEEAAAVLREAQHSPEYMKAVEESKGALAAAMDRLRATSGAVEFPLEEAEALSWVWRALESAVLRIGAERGVSLYRAYAEQRRQWESERRGGTAS